MAFQEGTVLDRQGAVEDVADHMGGARQADALALDLAGHAAVDLHQLGDDLAVDAGGFAHQQDACADIAFDGAVDLDFAVAVDVADDPEVVAKNRGNGPPFLIPIRTEPVPFPIPGKHGFRP